MSEPQASGAVRRRTRSRWWQRHALDRIARCVPPDCREEVREVLNSLDPDNPVAALLFLIREYKVEVLATRAAMVRRSAAPDAQRGE